MPLSKWFVGSSKIRRSHGFINAIAKATLLSCPPDNSLIFCFSSKIPNLPNCALISKS